MEPFPLQREKKTPSFRLQKVSRYSIVQKSFGTSAYCISSRMTPLDISIFRHVGLGLFDNQYCSILPIYHGIYGFCDSLSDLDRSAVLICQTRYLDYFQRHKIHSILF